MNTCVFSIRFEKRNFLFVVIVCVRVVCVCALYIQWLMTMMEIKKNERKEEEKKKELMYSIDIYKHAMCFVKNGRSPTTLNNI